VPVSQSPPAAPPPAPPTAQKSLKSEMRGIQSYEDVKTEAHYNIAGAEPVVGWLVCIGGEYFGESFNLKAGQNFVGRALNMDVPLAKDTSVSRNRHAIITYDPKNRVFYVQQGESNGLTYHNGGLLLAPSPLKSYDKFQVGDSEFVFIACCGEQFSWDDYSQ
jgi:hypothetical protein